MSPLPFEKTATTLRVKLAPRFISKPREGIDLVLNQMLMRFSMDLGGVVLSYSKVRPASPVSKPSGMITGINPYIYVDVALEALVFKAELGSQLVGTVNKVGESHIGLLVHGLFNASVAELPEAYTFDHASGCWTCPAGQESCGLPTAIGIGTEMSFVVRKVYTEAGLISIQGTVSERDFARSVAVKSEAEPVEAPVEAGQAVQETVETVETVSIVASSGTGKENGCSNDDAAGSAGKKRSRAEDGNVDAEGSHDAKASKRAKKNKKSKKEKKAKKEKKEKKAKKSKRRTDKVAAA
jgi:hypothetical protein